jgi:deazaflavin-dependent oxidoreductase (nitroreductase family)
MNAFFKFFVKLHVWLYKATRGRIGSRMRGRNVILLTTTGRKSGEPRTVPVVPFQDGEDMYVMASMAGAPQHPAWFHNLKANPDVGVQLGSSLWPARAEIAEEADRERVWKKITAAMPDFGEYQKKTKRVIPVVKLVKQS